MKLFSNCANLCDHDRPDGQMDGQSGDMPWQYRALRSVAW